MGGDVGKNVLRKQRRVGGRRLSEPNIEDPERGTSAR
jgi:hypothetical protein